jgi:hypothetical protein
VGFASRAALSDGISFSSLNSNTCRSHISQQQPPAQSDELITLKHQFRNLLATPSACNRLVYLLWRRQFVVSTENFSTTPDRGVWMSDIKGAVYRLGAP